MSSVKLKHALGGSTTLEAGNTSSAETVTLPAGNNTLATETQFKAAGGRKNLIINGGMQVAQRGTSFTRAGWGYTYQTADRWQVGYYSCAGEIVDNVELPNGDIVATIKNKNTENTGGVLIAQPIEFGKKVFNDKTVTLSFWIKTDTTATNARILFDGGSLGDYTIDSISSTWTKVSYTKTFGDLSAWADDKAMTVYIGAADGFPQNEYTHIAQVQLELGSQATDFEHRSYGEELALCQRYCYLLIDGGSQSIGPVSYYTSSHIEGTVNFPITMRIAPSMIATSGSIYYRVFRHGAADELTSVSASGISRTGAKIYNSSEGNSSVGAAGHLISINANAYIYFDAEL